jgi:hypothetical protein
MSCATVSFSIKILLHAYSQTHTALGRVVSFGRQRRGTVGLFSYAKLSLQIFDGSTAVIDLAFTGSFVF